MYQDSNREFATKMGVNPIPHTFLLNGDKKIVWDHVTYSDGDEEELYEKILELTGVGFRASLKGKQLNLQLGFSHDINFDIPEGIKILVEKQTVIKITGIDSVATKYDLFNGGEDHISNRLKNMIDIYIRWSSFLVLLQEK